MVEQHIKSKKHRHQQKEAEHGYLAVDAQKKVETCPYHKTTFHQHRNEIPGTEYATGAKS